MYIFELNGILGTPPDGWQDLINEISFENDSPNASLNSVEFTFKGERAIEINKFIEDFGVFNGMSYKIYKVCNGVQEIYLDTILDFTSENAKFSCDEVTVPLIQANKIDSVLDKIDGFGMAYLHKGLVNGQAGKINRTDFTEIYYAKSSVPDWVEVITIGMSIYVMTKELIEQTRALADAVAEFTNSVTPIVVVGTGAATGPNYGAIVKAAAKVVFQAAYVVAITLALVQLLKLIINNAFPIPRVHYGMKAETMFEKGCEFLGLTFKSSIFQNGDYDNMIVIPDKNEVGEIVTFKNKSTEVGYEPTETFGDFIREMILVFNAKFKVLNGEFIFERSDKFKRPSGFIVPPIELRYNHTNASSIKANYYMTYAFDNSDLQTMNASGYALQNTVSLIDPLNPNTILLKGLERKDFKYSQATRKESQTDLEEILGTFANTVLNFISVFSAGSVKLPKKANSIGYWLLENDFSSTPRLAIASTTNGLIDPLSALKLHVLTLWNNFHSINSPVPSAENPIGNQYTTFKDLKIDLCCTDFKLLEDNNVGQTESGKEIIFDSIKHNDFDGTAEIDIKINETIAKGLQEVQIIDGKVL